jgi:hypothetical protein
MDTPAADVPEPVLLVIADISGYTRYMTANVKTFAHSQAIITELIKAMVQAVELPLEVAKLEGDAVFLFARKSPDLAIQADHKRSMGQKLIAFFEVFRQKLHELALSTTCTCNACTHIERLRLKLVVHSGEALFHKVLNFEELAGVDVIIVHRLLKNSLSADQYLLVTESAQNDLELPAATPLVPGTEVYDDIGQVRIGVYYPEPQVAPTSPKVLTPPPDFPTRFKRAWTLLVQLWFRPLRKGTALGPSEFRHLETTPNAAARLGFALLTLVLTPIYLPVGAFRVWLRARQPPASDYAADPGQAHEHAPDSSCCNKNP